SSLMRSFLHLSYITFFSTHTSTTHIYTLSLHDALPILMMYLSIHEISCSRIMAYDTQRCRSASAYVSISARMCPCGFSSSDTVRSEEHTSELQSRVDLVCRLLLEKKK